MSDVAGIWDRNFIVLAVVVLVLSVCVITIFAQDKKTSRRTMDVPHTITSEFLTTTNHRHHGHKQETAAVQIDFPAFTMPSSTSEQPEGFNPSPREEWKLIFQGAEAKVWQLSGNDGKAQWICKERFSKAYRHPVLDERLTKSRCRSEARILEKCGKTTDIRVPRVVRVDPPNLYLEFLEGQSLKDYWLKPNLQNGQHQIDTLVVAGKMGDVIGLLHNLGVIHGDLTTSNMMIQYTGSDYELVMIDFGLAKSTNSVEEQAVDLYVLERALQSTHPGLPENFFEVLLESYTATTASSKKSQNTLQRLEQVRLRGRKRECFG